MAVPPTLLPSHSEKVLGAIKAERTVKRITFNPTSANPGETLYVSVPKLSEHEVLVSGSLALVFNINLSGGHANNYLVQNVSRALVDKLHVKFAATSVQDTHGYDIYKIFEDLFLSADERANMLSEGTQSTDLCKIRSGAGDKKTSGVDEENKLNGVYNKAVLKTLFAFNVGIGKALIRLVLLPPPELEFEDCDSDCPCDCHCLSECPNCKNGD